LVKRREGENKYFLLGHSLGALIVLAYLMHGYNIKISGSILSAPPLELVRPIPAYKRAVGNQLSKIFPTLSFFNEIDPTLLSHDLKVITSYMNDPLVYRRASVRFLREFLRAVNCIKCKPHLIKVPVLIVQGESDKICDYEGTQKFFEQIPHDDKSFIHYHNFYHEVMNEVKRDRVFKDMDRWLMPRL
jgi:alpha-beta hydrolase superfamily lysophospholipase